jgi:hypothetical protein
MLLYSICYYYGKNNKNNIINHLAIFSKINVVEKEFIITAMIDSHDTTYFNHVENELGNFIQMHNPTIRYKILTSFNWGGTIAGLWLTYNYGKMYNHNNQNNYVAHFEEDFVAINDKWYPHALEYLNTNTEKFIYIGEHISNKKSNNIKENVKKTPKNEFIDIINKYNRSTYENMCCWTDGGFYFSTISKLQQIEDKIGIYHKGDNCVKYDHYVDGIVLGEVGFPTLLYHHQFHFGGLYRPDYFVHHE